MRGHEVMEAVNNGTLVKGDTVWVCCFYYRDVANSKPTRNVEPVKVTRVDDEGANVWFQGHVLFDTVDAPVKKTIPLINNVRDAGAILTVVATEEECRAEYLAMIEKVRQQVVVERARSVKALDALDASLDKFEAKWDN